MTTNDERWVTVQELLREEIGAELRSREGQWTAFREQVQWRLDREAGALQQMDLEDRAIRALTEEVDGELGSMSARFEGAFREELESRIFRTGMEPAPWWRRWWSGLKDAASPAPAWGMAVATGAAAVALAVGIGSQPDSEPGAGAPPQVAPKVVRSGTVMVDELSFEGSATVTVDQGATVVMLASVDD